MKKTLIVFSLMALPFLALAEIPEIDSSKWNTDPEKYGMTAKEFIQAESRAFIATFIDRNGINKWFHFKTLANKDDKWVVSPNNDTVYSIVAVNVSQGFELVLPEVEKDRFLSTHILDENHMSPFYLYGGGKYTFTADQFESEFVVVGIRMGTDGTSEDVKRIVENLQPQYQINGAKDDPNITRPDQDTMLKVRTAMIAEYDKLEDTFGAMVENTSQVTDWEKFTYVTAGAWGLSKDEYAMYAPYAKNSVKGGECYEAIYPPVPAEAFFSITVYNQDKFLMADFDNIVSTNQGALLNDDGSFTVRFGGEDCRVDGKNFLYTPEDNWSFLMRAYRPRVEEFKTYEMPEIMPVSALGEAGAPVTMENYVVAESDWYFDGVQKKVGVNVWMHDDPVSKDNQQVIRSNRDVVYSIAIVDVSKGATFTVPKSNEFQAIHIIDEAHLFHQVVLNGQSLTVNSDDIQGEYVYLLARTRDNGDAADTKTRQRALKFEAKADRPYKTKGFDADEVIAFREELVRQVNAGEQPIAGHDAFGKTIADVNPHNYLYAAAYGWGGLPMTTAQYVPLQVSSSDCQSWTLPKPALDWNSNGFMSATFYGADGWIHVDDFYIPHSEMKDNGDTLSFTTNCEKGAGNATVVKGGNFLVRMYLPSDPWKVKETADSMYSVKGAPVSQQ
jgi:hypothetical protein